MNKICIDTRIFNLNIENDNIYEIDNIDNNVDITINVFSNTSSVINFLIKNSNINITINLLENSNLIINQLGINSSININSNLESYSNLKYIDSILTDIDSINNIKIINKGNFSKCVFLTNGINLSNNKFYFIIDGIINKNCHDVYLEENSKIINILDGNSKIIPNLLIDSKDIVANHSAYIGNFNKEYIYYLNSRGIDELSVKKILLKALLIGNMECDNKKFIDEINLINNKINN